MTSNLDRFLSSSRPNHSKNGLQPQLIRYDASVEADTPNRSLAIGVNEA